MFCSNCGKSLDDNTKVCPACGWKEENKKETTSKISSIQKNFKNKIKKEHIIIVAITTIITILLTLLFSGAFTKKTDGWYYYRNGKILTNDWVSFGSDYCYVGPSGNILKSQWIDNTYYVDENGKMLKNAYTPDGYFCGPDGKYQKYNFNSNLVKIYEEINSNPQYTYGAHDHLGLPHNCYHEAKFTPDGNLWLKGGAGTSADGWFCIDIISPTNARDSYYNEIRGRAETNWQHNNKNVSKDVLTSIYNQYINIVDAYKK